MKNSRKLHDQSRRYQESLHHKNDGWSSYEKVKPTLNTFLDRTRISIPRPHRKNTSSIDDENQKLYDRLLNVKSEVFNEISNVSATQRKILPTIYTTQLSKMYNESRIKVKHPQRSKIKLSKKKYNLKITVDLNHPYLQNQIKEENELFHIEVSYCNKTEKIDKIERPDLFRPYTIYLRCKNYDSNITVRISRILPEKNLLKVQF